MWYNTGTQKTQLSINMMVVNFTVSPHPPAMTRPYQGLADVLWLQKFPSRLHSIKNSNKNTDLKMAAEGFINNQLDPFHLLREDF